MEATPVHITVNPATGEELQSYPYLTAGELKVKLAKAEEALGHWREKKVAERAAIILKIKHELLKSKHVLAEQITLEMGKPITEAIAEVEKSAFAMQVYADHAETWLLGYGVDEPRAQVSYQPLGAILAIMPWNFPVWQVVRAAVPALCAGNVVMLKHADNVAGVSQMISSVFNNVAGLSLLTDLRISEKECGDLIGHPLVKAVTLTGSDRAGRQVARLAGAELKKVVLELGGSDPYLVLRDADVELAARVCADSRLINAGQSCVAAKRFIVEKPVLGTFLEVFTKELSRRVVGDPQLQATAIGPLARADLRLSLHRQVEKTVQMGATLVLGGEFDGKRPGFYYPPTLLSDVLPGMPGFDEELFGPVACVTGCESEEMAISLANQSRFGLGSAVFSSDRERAVRVAQRLNTGITAINQMVKSDPRVPFSGVKDSGFGVELGREGIREFTFPKVVL